MKPSEPSLNLSYIVNLTKGQGTTNFYKFKLHLMEYIQVIILLIIVLAAKNSLVRKNCRRSVTICNQKNLSCDVRNTSVSINFKKNVPASTSPGRGLEPNNLIFTTWLFASLLHNDWQQKSKLGNYKKLPVLLGAANLVGRKANKYFVEFAVKSNKLVPIKPVRYALCCFIVRKVRALILIWI